MDIQQFLSQFRLYSIGYAAENRRLDSWDLEITPVERVGYVDGEINAEQETIEDSGVDGFGQAYTAKVKSSNAIVASWFPFCSNRNTPPDIRRGERLLVWQYADTDKFYWTDTGLDGFLRRLETVIYAYSNTRDESVKKLTPDNSYYFEISTHNKHITLSTCKSDGEPFAYTMQLNTKDGVFTLMDDDGNFIEFDSAERKITGKNKDGSFISIDKRDIYMYSPDLIRAETTDVEIHCDTMVVNAASTLTENVGQSITINTATYNLNASTAVNITTPLLNGQITASTFTGTVTVQGLATLAGGIAAIAGPGAPAAVATISIPMQSSAAITVTGADVTADGIGLKTHKHTEQGDGAPTSSAIP